MHVIEPANLYDVIKFGLLFKSL